MAEVDAVEVADGDGPAAAFGGRNVVDGEMNGGHVFVLAACGYAVPLSRKRLQPWYNGIAAGRPDGRRRSGNGSGEESPGSTGHGGG